MKESDEAKALAKEFSTPARQLTVVQGGRIIVEPLVYVHKSLFHQLYELRFHGRIKKLIQESMDADEIPDLEEVFQQACDETKVTKEWAEEYFASGRYKAWVKDRVQEIQDHDDLTIPFLKRMELQSIRGEIKLTDSQHKSLDRVEKRVWPEVNRQDIVISKKESNTLDDMPDYQKKVDELEAKFRRSLDTKAEA